MTEGEIQKDIVNLLKSCNAIIIRHNAGRLKNNVKLSPDGMPDLQAILLTGEILFIEVKSKDGKIRNSQKLMHKDLELRGHKVIVARSIDDVKDYVK